MNTNDNIQPNCPTSEEELEYLNELEDEAMGLQHAEGLQDERETIFDLQDDADALASAGHGMDEDYGGGCDGGDW